jgi:bacterioferritin
MTRREPQAQQALVSREQLIDLLNEDLAREYQAIISYVIYSQVLKGAKFMKIAAELETHAAEELSHALLISRQIDYLGGMPVTTPKQVKTSENAEDMLRFDLQNETETIRHYRQRVRQCEALGEFAVAEHLREILMQEQDHQIALATALGVQIPCCDEETDSATAEPAKLTRRRAWWDRTAQASAIHERPLADGLQEH